MANSRRRLVGRVISDKMDKTVVVAIERRKLHRVYKKVIKSTKKVYAHDESNSVEMGSLVQVVESKPLSKTKRWVVEKVIEGPGGRVLEPIAGEVDVHPEEVVEAPAEAEAFYAESGQGAEVQPEEPTETSVQTELDSAESSQEPNDDSE
jgi:small subunit ribosomal protein S17